MNRRTVITTAITVALVVIAAVIGTLAVRRKPAPPAPPATAAVAPVSDSAQSQGRKIKAQLFYVSDDGMRLIGVEREVAFAERPVDQAREILAAQIAAAPAPLVSAVPTGTALRAIFLTDDGQAYVDLSRDLATAHPGGTLNEMLTIYTIVHALTFNLPAVTAVQLLVDGKEVDTLAGHVDLRRPLTKNLQLATEN